MPASLGPPHLSQNDSPTSGSSTRLVTSASNNSHSSSKSHLATLYSTLRRSANALGLPGLSEMTSKIEDIAKMLCDEPSTELSLLADRIQLILHTLRSYPGSHREEMKEVTRELEELLHRVNRALSGKRLISAERCDQYDDLSRQTTSQMEALSLQHMQRSLAFIENIETWQAEIDRQVQLFNELLGDHIQPTEVCSYVNDDFADKLAIIAEGQITHQEALSTYSVTDTNPPNYWNITAFDGVSLGNRNDTVLVSRATGFLDGVRVLRKSYSSPSPYKATELAKFEMKRLKKYFHPNVARIMGITKNCNGQVQEIVVSTGQMPHNVFLARTTDPSVLVNYFKGISAVFALRRSQSPARFNGGYWTDMQVDVNGRVIVQPFQENSNCWGWIENVTTMDPRHGSRNTSVKAVLDVCQRDASWLLQDGPAVEFLGLVSNLSPGFTALDVMAAAHIADVVPTARMFESRSSQPPGFTAVALDIGLYTSRQGAFERLEVMLNNPRIRRVCVEEVCQPESATTPYKYDIFEYLVAEKVDGVGYTPKLLTATTEWHSYELCAETTGIEWHTADMQGPVKAWQELRQRAACLVQKFGCRSRALAVALNVIFRCKIIRNNVERQLHGQGAHRVDTMCPDGCWNKLYYHRNPTARNNPRDFWGYYSTSPDPHTSCPVFHAKGQPVEYSLLLRYLKMSDGYEYRYKSMVLGGLQNIPGGFKG